MSDFQKLSRELIYCVAEKNSAIIKLYKQLAKKDKQLAHATKEIAELQEKLAQERFEKICDAPKEGKEPKEQEMPFRLNPNVIDDYPSNFNIEAVQRACLVKELEQAQIESDEVFEEAILKHLDELKVTKIFFDKLATSKKTEPQLSEQIPSKDEKRCESQEMIPQKTAIHKLLEACTYLGEVPLESSDEQEVDGQDEEEAEDLVNDQEGSEEEEDEEEEDEEEEDAESEEEETDVDDDEEMEGEEEVIFGKAKMEAFEEDDFEAPEEEDQAEIELSDSEVEDADIQVSRENYSTDTFEEFSDESSEEESEEEYLEDEHVVEEPKPSPNAGQQVPALLSTEEFSGGEESPDSPRSIASDFVMVNAFPEDDILCVMRHGNMSHEKAIQALQSTQGSVVAALLH